MSPEDILHAFSEIVAIDEEIRTRILQNTGAPVARLPPEILSEIFIWLRDAHIQTHGHEASFLTGHSWIRIAHVSHSWRETALATPLLWCCIDIGMEDAACEYIRRACGVSLEIFFSDEAGDCPSQRAINAACAHPGKICALTLTGISKCLSSLVLCSADTIRVLEITSPNNKPRVPLPAVSLPRLEILALERCIFSWTGNMLSHCSLSLRRILIRDCVSAQYLNDPFGESRPVELPAMLDALRSFKGLEVLILRHSWQGYAYTDSLPELRLPSLHYLYLAGLPAITRMLCRTLRIPDTCRVDVRMRCGRQTSPELVQDVAALFLPPTIHVLHLGAPSSLLVHGHGRTLEVNVTSAAWGIRHLSMPSAYFAARAAHVLLKIDSDITITGEALRVFCGGSEAVATHLTLRGFSAVVAECMADAAGFLPRLEYVYFEDCDLDAVDAEDMRKWEEALLERRKAGAQIVVNYPESK